MRWLLVPAVFLLASCAAMTKVGPGETVVRESLTVRLDQGWNKLAIGTGKVEIWTTEGLPLDTLRFYVDVKDGEPLQEVRGANQKQVPQFRTAMEPREVVEMFEVSSVADGSRFRLTKLAPANFLGSAGFRFDYTLVRKADEVELKGFGYGAIRDGRLTLIVFEAPKTHYYGKVAPRAEAVVASARITK
jgi:hypothetical protein